MNLEALEKSLTNLLKFSKKSIENKEKINRNSPYTAPFNRKIKKDILVVSDLLEQIKQTRINSNDSSS